MKFDSQSTFKITESIRSTWLICIDHRPEQWQQLNVWLLCTYIPWDIINTDRLSVDISFHWISFDEWYSRTNKSVIFGMFVCIKPRTNKCSHSCPMVYWRYRPSMSTRTHAFQLWDIAATNPASVAMATLTSELWLSPVGAFPWWPAPTTVITGVMNGRINCHRRHLLFRDLRLSTMIRPGQPINRQVIKFPPLTAINELGTSWMQYVKSILNWDATMVIDSCRLIAANNMLQWYATKLMKVIAQHSNKIPTTH